MVMYGGDTTEERRLAIEQRLSAQQVADIFDDDGDGQVEGADLAKLEQTMADADDVVTGILLGKGWTEQQLEDALRLDRQVIRCWVGIFAQLAGERRTERLDDEGRGPFDALGVRGRAELGKLARGELRSAQESAVGGAINASIGGQVETRPFFYAPDPRDPEDQGPGGF